MASRQWLSLSGILACAICLSVISSSADAKVLEVSAIGSAAQVGQVSGYAELNGRLLVSTRAGTTTSYQSFDGVSFSSVANGVATQLPPVRTAGMIRNGEYLFVAQSATGTALFKTEGTVTQLVADFDPSNSTEQTIQSFATNGSSIYVLATGQHGREVFRVDGGTIHEYDAALGPTFTNPFNLQSFQNHFLFSATDNQTSLSSIYRTNGNAIEKIADAGLPVQKFELGGRLHWIANGQLQSYDGSVVSTISQFAGITSLNMLAPPASPSNALTLIGMGPNGWSLFTWDGVTKRDFDIDPTGVGTSVDVLGYLNGAFYVSRGTPANGREPYRVDETSVTLIDLAPGPASSGPDANTGAVIDGKLIFRATGLNGNELYRVSDSAVELLADINPSGDAFPLSTGVPQKFLDHLYFRASSPQGAEIFRTDGTTVSLFADLLPGPASSNGNFAASIRPIAGASLFEMPTDSPQLMNPFVSDGDEVWALTQEVNAQFPGQQFAGMATFEGDLLYFSTTGQVFRISVVPEPTTAILLGAAGAAMTSRFRRRKSGHN
jgi:ELWxxDGT repeat protein